MSAMRYSALYTGPLALTVWSKVHHRSKTVSVLSKFCKCLDRIDYIILISINSDSCSFDHGDGKKTGFY